MLGMLRRIVFATALIVAVSTAASAAKIGPTLVSKLNGLPDEQLLKDTLVLRRMDTLANGLFRPNQNVTRAHFARTLALNTPLRQTLAATPRFTDVSGSLVGIAEAVTANG